MRRRTEPAETAEPATMFYDTHTHLDARVLASDLDGVLTRAHAAGVTRIITVGTDLESSHRAVALAERYPNVFAAVGWHPCQALEAPPDLGPALRQLASHPRVVALGETGLDHFHLPSRRGGSTVDDERHQQRQRQLFALHLELAGELGLNCVVHHREALDAVLDVMTPFQGRVHGQFHCFVSDVTALQRVLALGSVVSFTGVLTFKNAATVRETLAATPVDQFMLETDSPYLAPLPHFRTRCEPAYVIETATVAAQVRGMSLAALAEATCGTARRFFARLG